MKASWKRFVKRSRHVKKLEIVGNFHEEYWERWILNIEISIFSEIHSAKNEEQKLLKNESEPNWTELNTEESPK